MKTDNPPKYPCPMGGMYAAGRTVCNLAIANRETFIAFSPRYEGPLISLLLTEITAAEAMPGESNRAGRRNTSKDVLVTNKKAALRNFRWLVSYIKTTWTEPGEQAGRLRSAGASLYAKASKGAQWALALQMFQDGADFINTNKKALMESKAMPDTFQAQYLENMTTYANTWESYSGLGGDNEIESSEKRKANNIVYDKIIQICKDGQLAFAKNSTMKKRFAFSQIVKQLGFSGTAGMAATFTYGPYKLPIADVDGVSVDLKYNGISNAKGILKINRMSEGEHTFTFSALGFQDLTATVTLQAGIKSRFDFTLLEEVMEVQEDVTIAKAA